MRAEQQQAIQTDLDALWAIYVNGAPDSDEERVHGMDFLATLLDYALRVTFNSRGSTADLDTLKHLIQASMNCVATRESLLALVPPAPAPITVSGEPANITPIGGAQ